MPRGRPIERRNGLTAGDRHVQFEDQIQTPHHVAVAPCGDEAWGSKNTIRRIVLERSEAADLIPFIQGFSPQMGRLMEILDYEIKKFRDISGIKDHRRRTQRRTDAGC
jgi:hypothetical protein